MCCSSRLLVDSSARLLVYPSTRLLVCSSARLPVCPSARLLVCSSPPQHLPPNTPSHSSTPVRGRQERSCGVPTFTVSDFRSCADAIALCDAAGDEPTEHREPAPVPAGPSPWEAGGGHPGAGGEQRDEASPENIFLQARPGTICDPGIESKRVAVFGIVELLVVDR